MASNAAQANIQPSPVAANQQQTLRRTVVFIDTRESQDKIADSLCTGLVAEWSCSGLQIRVRRFDSDPGLHGDVTRSLLECTRPRGAVAQLGERRVRNAKVKGSIPLSSTNIQRPTSLGWSFLFPQSGRVAGLPRFCVCQALPGTSGRPACWPSIRPLCSLEICANRIAVAHADRAADHQLVPVSIKLVASPPCRSSARYNCPSVLTVIWSGLPHATPRRPT